MTPFATLLTATMLALALPQAALAKGPVYYMLTLGTLGGGELVPKALNDKGQVVGLAPVPSKHNHAFITDPNGKNTRDLGTLGGTDSSANAINSKGQVVGGSSDANGVVHAFVTGPNGQDMRALVGFPPDNLHAVATAINDRGQVAGWFLRKVGDTYYFVGFITGPGAEGITELGDLGGGRVTVTGINEQGQVTGYAINAAGEYRAFITDADGANLRALDLPAGKWGDSEGYAINEKGQVAGRIYKGSQYHAFLTGPNGVGMRLRQWTTWGGSSDVRDSVAYGPGRRNARVVGSADKPAGRHQ